MTERQMYADIRRTLYEVLDKEYDISDYGIDVVRIESGSTPGIPDINACIDGQEFWIECKVESNKLEPAQVAWKRKRELASGKVYVVTQISKKEYELSTPKFIDRWISLFDIVKYILKDVMEGENDSGAVDK